MSQFESAGVTLSYDDIGPKDDRRPIILIHGFATNRNENWRRVGWYGALERRRVRFVAFDCRGHGASAKLHDRGAYGVAMIDDIFRLLDHLAIPRADLMGYSMGARLALSAALARPDRVGDLILGGVGGKLFDPLPPGTPMADAMEAEAADAIGDPLLRGFRQFADEQGEDRIALAVCAGGAVAPPSRDEVSSVAAHTLVVAGARDDLAGDIPDLVAALHDARGVAIPGCDHFSAIPHALFKAAVFDFLDGEL